MDNTSIVNTSEVLGHRSGTDAGPRQFYELGETLGAILGLDARTRAESYTWSIQPDPCTIVSTTGNELFRFSKRKVTKVRAPLTEGGYKAYITVTFVLTSLGWYTTYNHMPPLKWYVNLYNLQEGVLLRLDSSTPLECNVSRDVFFSQDIDPDIYDLATNCDSCIDRNTVYRC